MDFYELLKKGVSIEDIHDMVLEEIKAADVRLDQEREEEKLKEKALKDRAITLADARAHLISAFGLYNEVFKFTEFNDEDAEILAETLKECEEFITKYPDIVKMYITKDEPKVKRYKSHILDVDDLWRKFGI